MTLIAIPTVILAVTAGGTLLCIAAGINPHFREMLCAACGCLIASELAVVPLALTRGATQPAVAQAGLVGTMIHLFGCSGFGAAIIILKIGRLDASVVYWLLTLYWATLSVLVAGFVTAVKKSPIATSNQQDNAVPSVGIK
jgi:hypothetical protein